MVIFAILFSHGAPQWSAGPLIHIGPTVMTMMLGAAWWILRFAAFSLVGGGVRALFRREGLRAVWSYAWRAMLLWCASAFCCLVFNVWVFPLCR